MTQLPDYPITQLPNSTVVAIALGSNLGDRAAHLTFAAARLARVLSSMITSRWHETEPVGVGPQPLFLNGAAVGQAELSPRALLDAMLAIERERGRERPFGGAPRTLDLDLVLFGDQILNESGLTVPHPRFRERRFVLEPLAEIAPAMIDPATGLTIADLLARLQAAQHHSLSVERQT